jgi:tetratricopeptide (TPR) repeat protein
MLAMRTVSMRTANSVCAVLCGLAFAACACGQPSGPDEQAQAKQLIDSRQLDSAEKLIVTEMMTAPRDADWITLLAEVRLGQNRTREALELIAEANLIAGDSASRFMLISLAQSQAGHMDRAEPPIRAAIRLDPNNATAHYFLARLLYTDNRFDEAIVETQKTIDLAPDFVRAYENMGLCYEGKYRLDEAEHWYLQAIDHEAAVGNKTEWPMLDLAILLIHENRYPDAKPYLEKALAINPQNTQALVQLGTLLEFSGETKAALDEYRAAIRSEHANLQPGLASAYYKAARLARKLGYTEEAEQDFKKFNEVHDKQ